MIRIRLINEGKVVKQITSRLHEGVVLEQIKKYNSPYDTVQIIEGELSEDAKSMLQHVAKKIVPAALAAGMAMSGAGSAQAQGGANPNYPGLNHSVGQHMTDIFSPNYKEKMRQREYGRSTERQVWNAEQDQLRKQRIADARARADAGRTTTGAQHVVYDQSRISQDGKSYIIYGMDNKVRRIPVAGTEFMAADSQRLPHYISSTGSVFYVRHPHVKDGIRESAGTNLPRATMTRDKTTGNASIQFDGKTFTPSAPFTKVPAGVTGTRIQVPAAAFGIRSMGDVAALISADGTVYAEQPIKIVTSGMSTKSVKESAENKAEHDKGYSDASQGKSKNPYNPGSPAAAAYNAGQQSYKRHFSEGYTVTRGIDKERYQERPGLEGPFSTKSGKVVYYDKKEGKYYDPETDFYIGHEDYAKMDESDPNATVGTIPSSGTVGTSGGMSQRTQFAPTGKTTNAKFNKSGQIELDTDPEADGSVNLDADAVKQLQQAGVQIKEEDGHSPVAYAITRRIMTQRVDLLKDYGPVLVGQAIDEVADFVGDVEEIGSSDVSGWVKHVEQMLQSNPPEAFNEAWWNGWDSGDANSWADNYKTAYPEKIKAIVQGGGIGQQRTNNDVATAQRILLQYWKEQGENLTQAHIEKAKEQIKADVAKAQGLTEGSDTLEGILSKYSADYAKFKAGGDIDENQDFFDALYAHYADSGEMPYGIQKARDGDPYEWITQRLDQEAGMQPVIENLAEGAEQMTPNWAKYVLDQIYNSNGAVTLTDLFDEGIPGLHDMFVATAQEHGLDPEEDFEDVQHELTVELEDIIKGGHGLDEAEEDEATPGDQAAADQNIIMKIRKASDNNRPTRIELADGSVSVIAPNIAKQLLAKFDKMKPDSKALLQKTLNTEEGFTEILNYFGGGVREQAASRAARIMQSAMVEAGVLDDVRARMDARRNPPAKPAATPTTPLPTTPRPPVPPYEAPVAQAEVKAGDIIGYRFPGSKMMPIKAKVLKLMSDGTAMVSVSSKRMIQDNNGSPVISIGPLKSLEIQNPYQELSTKPAASNSQVAVMKEDTEDWLPAYKALAKNNGAPESLKFSDAYRNIIWKKQVALVAKANNIRDRNSLQKLAQDYSSEPDSDERAQYLAYEIEKLVSQAPSMAEMRKVLAQQPDTIHQQNITAIQNKLDLENVPMQHELSIQALLNKVELDQADQKELLELDMEARLAIVKMKQDLELDAKERLVAIEREIEDRKEREDIRKHDLEMAQAGYKHELAVIDATAEGEYKKAKLEADYQLHIKQLDNIDNAEERKSRLELLNAEKAKQLAVIDSETKARVEVMQKEVDVEQQSSDIKIQSAFMMAFKNIWADSLSAAQSAAGQAWDVGIANVKKALAMMSKPIMPTAQKESRYDRRDAGQRDYDSSVANMGKRQSYAYQQDGGANDEGWDKPERSYQAPQETYYVRFKDSGKVYKQKGVPKSFANKAAANAYAIAMIKNNPAQQGNILLSVSGEDKPTA